MTMGGMNMGVRMESNRTHEHGLDRVPSTKRDEGNFLWKRVRDRETTVRP